MSWPTLHDTISDLVTEDTLRDFVADSETRRNVLAGSIWGSIRWSRSLGRPMETPRTNGFSITHEIKQQIAYVDDGVERLLWLTAPWAAPVVWDGPDDDEYHRITYGALNSSTSGLTIITADLTSVRWQIA